MRGEGEARVGAARWRERKTRGVKIQCSKRKAKFQEGREDQQWQILQTGQRECWQKKKKIVLGLRAERCQIVSDLTVK